MNHPVLDKDVHPLSEFRAKASQLIEDAQNSGRPMVITQNGKPTAVMVSASAWEDLMEDIALIRRRAEAEADLKAGRTYSSAQVREMMQNILKLKAPLE